MVRGRGSFVLTEVVMRVRTLLVARRHVLGERTWRRHTCRGRLDVAEGADVFVTAVLRARRSSTDGARMASFQRCRQVSGKTKDRKNRL